MNSCEPLNGFCCFAKLVLFKPSWVNLSQQLSPSATVHEACSLQYGGYNQNCHSNILNITLFQIVILSLQCQSSSPETNKMTITNKSLLLISNCYSWLDLRTKCFSFHNVLLKLKSVIVWISSSRELWRWKQTVTPELKTVILSASLDTQRGKKPYFLFHIIKVSLLYLSLSQENQPAATHSQHHTASAYKRPQAPSRGQVAEPHGWGRAAHPPPPRNLHGWNHHPLVQIHLRVSLQCRLIDSACVEGLCAVYTECQASARQLSVRLQSEWRVMWGDGEGWKGGRGRVLPQESENLVWPGGFGCLREELLLLLRRWQTHS